MIMPLRSFWGMDFLVTDRQRPDKAGGNNASENNLNRPAGDFSLTVLFAVGSQS